MYPSTARRPAAALAIALVLALAPGIQAQSRAERAEAYLQSFHDLRRFNGAALIVDNGEVLFEGAFGEAGLPGGAANTPATRFRIASLTKQFTAALILRLEEEGLLRVDDPVGLHIEEFPPENAARITLHHLLTHTSGLPSYTGIPGFMTSRAALPHSPGEILALVWDEPLSFEPGADFEYSNSGYVLLGWIAERVTGMSYDEALRAYVLAPLELTDTGYDHELVPAEGHARGYARDLAGTEPARLIDPSVPYAAGMLYSTVGDLARWGALLFGADTPNTVAAEPAAAVASDSAVAVASDSAVALPEEDAAESPSTGLFRDPATWARMTTPDLASYAYGLVVRSLDLGQEPDVRVIEHSGGIFGFSSFLRVFPGHERLVVLLDNTSSDLTPLATGLTHLLWGLEAVPPKPWIAERLLPIIESGGVEAAMSRYENWRRTRPEEYDYSPDQVVMLAGHFRERDPATAVAIIDAYLAIAPETTAARLALAELHEEAGDLEAAAAEVEAALTYEPGVPRLLERLSELGVEPDPLLRLPVVDVEIADLALLAGEYRIDPATTLTVTLEEGVLMAGRTGEAAFPLLPQAPVAFLMRGAPVQLLFEVADGVARAVSVVEAGRRLTFPRLDP